MRKVVVFQPKERVYLRHEERMRRRRRRRGTMIRFE
jgi:hypothetical protein